LGYFPVIKSRIFPENIKAIMMQGAIIKNIGNHVIATQKPRRIRLKHNSGIQEDRLERVTIVMGNKQIMNRTAEQIKPAVKTFIIKWAATWVGKAFKS